MDRWFNTVLRAHKITVFPDESVTGGHWNLIFPKALAEFNRLCRDANLNVRVIDARTAGTGGSSLGPPAENSLGGADVLFRAVSGEINFTAMGNKVNNPRDGKPFKLSGTALAGLTLNARFQVSEGVRILKSIVCVPLTPTGQGGPVGSQKTRLVGDGVKLFIAVHELFHLTGLENSEHSPSSIPDVMCGPPISIPQFDAGSVTAPSGRGVVDSPERDKIQLKPPDNTPNGFIPGVFQPPLTISGRTVGLIQAIWGSVSP
jgi:hypothetical protein